MNDEITNHEFNNIPADWQKKIDALERHRALASAVDAQRLEQHKAQGKLHARERIEALCDANSFVELAPFAGLNEAVGPLPADGYICGFGKIDQRPVAIGAEDFTVQGGSIGIAGMTKRERIARRAGQEGMPLINILDGAGARAAKAMERYVPAPIDLQTLADLSGKVPSIAIVAGPSAGHGALTAALADLIILVEAQGALFSAGPPLVKAATGEQVDKETLGGAKVHCEISGVAHISVVSEQQAFQAAANYLSYFPSHANLPAPRQDHGDIGKRRLATVLELLPANDRLPYDIRPLIQSLADSDSVMEIQPQYGKCMVTTLARIGGQTVALIANQPKVSGGAIDAEGADKAARFMETIGSFQLPTIFLADNPGMLAGSKSEQQGILRAGAHMYRAQHRLRAPKLHITLRKAFGFGAPLMGMNLFDGRTSHFALPGVALHTMPDDAARRFIKNAAEHSPTPTEQPRKTAPDNTGPWKLAGEACYDSVLDPRDLRNAIIDWLDFSTV